MHLITQQLLEDLRDRLLWDEWDGDERKAWVAKLHEVVEEALGQYANNRGK